MSDKIKVLQLVPLGTDGITSLILNINERMDPNRVIFNYMTFYDRKEFNEEMVLENGGKKYVVPIDHFKKTIPRAFFKFFYAIKVIHECNPDIIHINASSPYDMLVGLSAKIAGTKKVIFHSHNSSMRKRSRLQSTVMEICKRILPLLSDCNLACSEAAAIHMFPKRIIIKKKYMVIHNGIDTSKYLFSFEQSIEYRKKLHVENNFVIGHIGRFSAAKNHKKLIEIFEKVNKRCSETKLLLIGSGELDKEIKHMVKEKRLSDKVIFYGQSKEIPQLLQAMDCFVFPSLYEGLPLVVLEAQASGLPTIMSDTITKEAGVTSLAEFFPLNATAEEWAEKIMLIKEKKENRFSRGEEIRKAGLDIEDITEQMMKQYISLLEK